MSLPKRSVLAWSVQAVLCRSTITIKSIGKRISRTPLPLNLTQKPNQPEQKITVYREYSFKLMTLPKCSRDQIIVELPWLNGFRTGEIITLRVNFIHFDTGDIEVLDSKKGIKFTIPADHTLLKHLDEYIHQHNLAEDDLIIKALPNAPHVGHKTNFNVNSINNVLKKLCKAAGIPYMSARMGRAYFATVEHFVLGKPTAYIQFMLRHDHLESTEHYLSKVVCYEDMKALFYRGKHQAFSLHSPCQLKDTCHGYEPGCRCRMFQTVEVKAEV